MILYRALSVLGFRPLLRTLYRIEVVGAEHIPARGPCILVSNHESQADPFLLGVVTTRPVRYMAKAELWGNRFVGGAMDAFGAFPIDRGRGDSLALDRGAELLAQDQVLGIFPQGTSRPFRERPFHRGAARLALLTGAPLVPVCMIGTERVLRPNRFKVGLPKVRILVAPAIEVARSKPTVVAARELTGRVEAAIEELRRPHGPPAHVWLD